MALEKYPNIAAQCAAKKPRKIRLLPPELANQIAAGEVVERPASVVKELVENSLDAGATHIEVSIEKGGRDIIRIQDDGCGMSREDARQAIERHATSKISNVDDLFKIGTLGFRGEALPSIGSVSRLEICTKPHDALGGTRLYIEGGELQEIEDIGSAGGTTIVVEELFFNTPARLKFLKTPATETRHIAEILVRMALSRPDVRFVFRNEGKVRLDFPRVDHYKDRLLDVLGKEVHDDLYPTFDYPAVHGVVARGFYSKPGHQQRTSGNIYVFVNGRYVSDSTIRAAIMGAYRHLLEKGRYPSIVLFVDVPFELVDINVHPAKTEVRFHDTQPIYRAVYHAIADALAQAPWVSQPSTTYTLKGELRHSLPSTEKMIKPQTASFEPLNARHRHLSQQLGKNGAASGFISPFFQSHASVEQDENRQQRFTQSSATPLYEPPRIAVGDNDDTQHLGSENYFSSLRVVGQFRRMYIVCEDASGMVIIDQHAAHERIGFERLKKIFHAEHKEKQPLLFPQRFEFDALRAASLEENLSFFENAGFTIEPFGGHSFALKEVPVVLQNANHERLIKDAVDDLSHSGRTDRVDEAMEAVLSRMACHSVVRGPTTLTQEECESLLKQMDSIDFKGYCPHGRPVYYRIPVFELEKSFERR